jgi:hypothetical protein
MLRSGAYLPGYVERVLKEHKGPPGAVDSNPFLFSASEWDKPLRALSKEEEKVFRQIVGRREEIAREVREIEAELLKNVKPFRLVSENSESSADDKKKIKRNHQTEERE